MRRVPKVATTKMPSASPRKLINRAVHYHVDDAAALKASHELAIKNHDSKGQDTNESRTEKLNQQNTEARTLIHIYSSHNPLDDTI